MPNDVISPARLAEALAGKVPATPSAAPMSAPLAFADGSVPDPPHLRTAVFIVHGISPIQRYAVQDQFADGLRTYLNASVADGNPAWKWCVSWPRTPPDTAPAPSAIRIYVNDPPSPAATDPADTGADGTPVPPPPYYDVYEGYWSPLTKGRATIALVARWLLSATFLASSSTAAIPATLRKLLWDAGYITAALACALAAVAVAIFSLGSAWDALKHAFDIAPATGAAPATVQSLLANGARLPAAAWVQIAIAVAIAFIVAQLISVVVHRVRTRARSAELRTGLKGTSFTSATVDAARWHEVTAILLVLVLLALVVADALYVGRWSGPESWLRQLQTVAWLVGSVIAVQAARAFADYIVENILGDLQVYTSHDENSSNFNVRDEVIARVTTALLGVLKADPPYERIHVAGHSLGSTIALDALMRVRMMVEEGSVAPAEWERIRSLTTFGTALEKTRFFFDVRHPTVSAAHDQWDADVYGRFFTADKTALLASSNKPAGIYWRNIWYARDVVANAVVSYRSDVPLGADFSGWDTTAGPRLLCDNGPSASAADPSRTALPHAKPWWCFVHGDYMGDPAFWLIAGDIVR